MRAFLKDNASHRAKSERVSTNPTMPTGTVAFLFSDIEGSTARWERDRDAMASALRRHDALLRDAIESCGGYVFKTIGDAFCAAFPTADAAIRAALSAHRGLAAEDFSAVDGLRVRIAIHVGVAEERDGDYFGPTVNRVARLLATAHGGQTILSASATDLGRTNLPPAAALVDLGTHRLKDLAEPEAVSQLNVPDLPSAFDPLRSLDASRNNLPTQLLPLLGREAVVAAIEDALSIDRLVTLVGEGGIGKTRTALHVAAQVIERFPGGVWYVGLSTIVDPAHVASQFLTDLGLRETPGRAPLESVILWLATREALIVVDNCEQIVAEAARIVRAITERCPKVRLLSTSREALGVYGERTVRMPTLTVPPASLTLTAEAARRYEAIALFEGRARAADPQFTLTDANAATIGDICRKLDGIALAIELAAARVKVLAPSQIHAKLDERFRLLTGGRRGAEDRQSTLHGAIAWSYDLLSERDRTIFERDGVFAGLWPLDAAISVCSDERTDDYEVIDAVEALVNKSLIAIDGDSEEKTYRLLESTKSFALLRLAERGQMDEMRARHAAYALAVSQRLDAEYLLLPTAMWERSTSAALADLRAAIAWTLDGGRDLLTGIALVANLRWLWSGIASSEGLALVRRARVLSAQCDLPLEVRGKLAIAEAVLATGLGDYRTQRDAAYRARQHWDAVGDMLERAIADRTYAQALLFLGDEREGLPILEAALGVFRQNACGTFASLALDTLGVHHFARGDIVTARGCLSEAIALARSSGFERGLLFFNVNLAEIEALSGNVEAAIALCRESLDQTYAKRELYTFALAWSNLAMYYTRLDRFDDALEAATAGFTYARESGVASFEAFALQSVAAVLVFRGDANDGARLAGYVDARIGEIGFERGATENTQYQRLLARARAIVGRTDVDMELLRGRSLTTDAAIALGGLAPAS